MSLLILPSRFSSQPQGPARIDRNNPLTRGLVLAVNFATGGVSPQDAVTGALLTNVGGIDGAATRWGKSGRGSASTSGGYQVPWDLGVSAGTFTQVFVCETPNASYWFYFDARAGSSGSYYYGQGSTYQAPNGQLSAMPFDNNPHVDSWASGVGFYRDGIKVYAAADTFTMAKDLRLLSRYTNEDPARSRHSLILIHNRVLSGAEIARLHANPWQVFEPFRRKLYVIGAGGADVSANATGVSSTAAAGTASVTGGASVSPSGVLATGSAGTAAATVSIAASPSGVEATSAAGTASVTGTAQAAATGAAATGSAGTAAATGDASVVTTGVGATGTAGTAVATVSITASPAGVASTSAAGTATVSAGATATASGVEATGAAGTVTVTTAGDATASVSGVEATAAAGTASATGTASVTATGVAATGSAGTATVAVGMNAAATGVEAAAAAGTAAVVGASNTSATGVEAAAAAGTVTVTTAGDATATATGVAAASAAGTASVTGTATVSPTGVAATAAAGTVTVTTGTNASVNVTGVAATAAAGTAKARPYQKHRFWRVYVDSIVSGNVSIGELELRATPGGADQTSGLTVTASSEYDGTQTAAKATDNNSATEWASNGAPPQWLKIDAGVGQAIAVAEWVLQARANPSFSGNTPVNCHLDFSDDNVVWYTYDTRLNETGWSASEARTYTIDPPVTPYARYWEWRFTAGVSAYATISEAQFRAVVGGQDQTKYATASADSLYSVSYPASQAFDDSNSTQWTSSTTYPHWLRIDAGANQRISVGEYTLRAKTEHVDDAVTAWTLRRSDDASVWTAVDVRSGQSFSPAETKTYTIPETVVTVTGVAATASAGTVSVSTNGGISVNATGVAATSAAGTATVTGTASVTATGAQATSAAGTASVGIGIAAAATGVQATAAAGTATVTAGASASATGAQASGAAGTAAVSAGASTAATGVAATGAAGTASVGIGVNATATGVAATSAAGTATVTTTGDAIASATGVAAGASAGTATVTGTAVVSATGVQAAGATGTADAVFALDASASVTGVAASSAAGTVASVTGGASATPAGVSAAGAAGTASVTGTALVLVPTGAAAFAQIGTALATSELNTLVPVQGVACAGETGIVGVVGDAHLTTVGVVAFGRAGRLFAQYARNYAVDVARRHYGVDIAPRHYTLTVKRRR